MPNEHGALTAPELAELTTKFAWALGTTFQEPYYGKTNKWRLLANRMARTFASRPELLVTSPDSPDSSAKG